MNHTLLDIEVYPDYIILIAKSVNELPIHFQPIKRTADPINMVNLRRQLRRIQEKTNYAPIAVVTLPGFLVLYEILSFRELVNDYGVSVPGYTIQELSARVEQYDLNKKVKNVSQSSGRYPWGDKSRQSITVDHIFYDDVATVVFWTDGTKTVVKCAEGTKYDEYSAFCIALAKKIYGNNSALKRSIRNHARYSKKRQMQREPQDSDPQIRRFVETKKENKDA